MMAMAFAVLSTQLSSTEKAAILVALLMYPLLLSTSSEDNGPRYLYSVSAYVLTYRIIIATDSAWFPFPATLVSSSPLTATL